MTTDTPRTDAASFSSRDPMELMMTSRQLERELNDLWSRFDKQMEAESRLAEAEELIKRGHDGWQKAEAEVERLRAFIKSKLPPPPYGELEPEWKYAEKLLAETAPLPEEA